MSRTSILIVGVGGQGVVSAAHMLGEAAHEQGIQASVGQLHGLAQRGGAVQSAVLLGEGLGAVIPASGADVVLAFEPMEAARAASSIGARTLVLASSTAIEPQSLAQRGRPYPDRDALLSEVRKRAERIVLFDAASLALRAGHARCVNVVMLGALAGTGRLGLDASRFGDVIVSGSPPAWRDRNAEAFRLGLLVTRERADSKEVV